MRPDLGLAFCDFWPGFVPEKWSLFRLLQEAFGDVGSPVACRDPNAASLGGQGGPRRVEE